MILFVFRILYIQMCFPWSGFPSGIRESRTRVAMASRRAVCCSDRFLALMTLAKCFCAAFATGFMGSVTMLATADSCCERTGLAILNT